MPDSVKAYRLALPVGLSAHCQVHPHFGALALEVGTQPLEHLRVHVLDHTDSMLVGPSHVTFDPLGEFLPHSAALWAFLRGSVALVNITTYGTNPFLHRDSPFFKYHISSANGATRRSPGNVSLQTLTII